MKTTILVVLLTVCASLPTAVAVPQQNATGISSTVLSQIAALQRDKAARTPRQRRIDSRLLHAQQAALGRAIVPGVAANVRIAADGRQLLDVRADVTDALVAEIQAAGADVISRDERHHAIHVQASLDLIDLIAALPGVTFIAPLRRGHTLAYRSAFSTSHAGLAISQGDATHGAATARSTHSVDGTGVKIGVLSDGVGNLAASQASGDLGTVTVLSGQAGSGSEGTAMLEIIHDLAPGAQLFFATATTSNTSFASNIRALRAAGCDIIVDDVYYANESPFQDGQAASVNSSGNAGVIAEAVKEVAASGALYFSAAGDFGNLNDGSSGTWEGDYVDGGGAGSPILSGQLHRFGSQNWNVLTATVGNPISLYWSDPLGAASNDYDLYRLNSTGTTLLDYSLNFQNGTQDPYEEIAAGNVGDRIVVVKFETSDLGRFLHLNTTGGRLSIATTGETHGHAATTAVTSFGVAATPATSPGPYPGRFTAFNAVETFSSDGPRRIFFTSNGTAITAGNFSSTGGLVLNKPDFTAADQVSTTVPGYTTYSGTSAAAPHAAAIAALIKSWNLSLTAVQIRSRLIGGAIDIEAAGVDRDSGAGIIMADTAIANGGAAFTDDPLVAGTTPVKMVHITELRQYVNTLRSRYGLAAAVWTDPTISAGTTLIKAVHITELRTALSAVYAAAGLTPPSYTTITAGVTGITAAILTELRTAIATVY